MATAKKEVELTQEQKNMVFWESVEKTDPKYTKTINFGRKYTAIDAYYQIKKATEKLGMYGEFWGLKNITFEKVYIGEEIMLELKAVFYYDVDSDFEINNAGMLAAKTKDGNIRIDTDAYKKLETDTLTKALSKIGFNTDVFLGKYEDQNYVNEVGAEFQCISQGQLSELSKLIQETKTDLMQFNNAFNIDKTAELPQSEFNKALAMLNAKKAKIAKEESGEDK